MLNTLISVALSIPPTLATAAQGIGRRQWERELFRRLELRLWTVQRRPILPAQVHTREGDSTRSGSVTALLTPPQEKLDTFSHTTIALQVERTTITARTRHKLASLLQRRVATHALVIVLYAPNPKAPAPPQPHFPEGTTLPLNIPHPIDWPDETLTKSRQQSRIRLGPSYRGATGGGGGAPVSPLPSAERGTKR